MKRFWGWSVLLLLFTVGCNFEEAKTSDKKDTKKIDTKKDVVEKDGKTKSDEELDEKALNLKELSSVWDQLDFKKHKVRTQGYVIKASIHEKLQKCIVSLAHYPFVSSSSDLKTFGISNLFIQFEEGMYDEKSCSELNQQHISLYIENPLGKSSELSGMVAFAKKEIIEAEDASEKFAHFYEDLIEGIYPEVIVLELEDFKKVDEKVTYLVQAEVVSVKSGNENCYLYLEDAEESVYFFVSFEKDERSRFLDNPLTQESCKEMSGKIVIGEATRNSEISDKHYFLKNYSFFDVKVDAS